MVAATTLIDHHAPAEFIENHVQIKPGELRGGHGNHGLAHGEHYKKALIGGALRERVESIDYETCAAGDEDSFFVADLGEVYRQHLRWKLNLPRVKPFYAVKCNPDPHVLRLLANLGLGFDCASKAEIQQVLDMGVAPNRIIYAQPCKTNSYVRYVAAQGVAQMTFDNADELYKIARLFPTAELFLRILTDDSSSLCRLSQKFGASLDSTYDLLSLARQLGLNVVGVSFHVGSGASDPCAFLKAVRDAHVVFQQADSFGYKLKTLDVGGGFCSDATFEDMAGVLRRALDEYFPPHCGVNLIAEPGRYFVSAAFTIACNIIARRTIGGDGAEGPAAQQPETPDIDDVAALETPGGSEVSDSTSGGNGGILGNMAIGRPTTSYMVYVNDGLYGNFSSIMFDHQHPEAKLLRVNGKTLYNTPAACQVVSAGGPSTPATPGTPCSIPLSGPGAATGTGTGTSTGTTPIEYSIWGPTCDGIDRITASICFDAVLDVGDWLYFEDMGAYTRCSATKFNGFSDNHDVIYVCSEPGAKALLGMS